MEWGSTIGTHGALGGSNGVRYDLPNELAMPVASYGLTYVCSVHSKLNIKRISVCN